MNIKVPAEFSLNDLEATWADFDAVLPKSDLLIDPGPPWIAMPDLMQHIQERYGVGTTTARRRVLAMQKAGTVEIRDAKVGHFLTRVCRVVKPGE